MVENFSEKVLEVEVSIPDYSSHLFNAEEKISEYKLLIECYEMKHEINDNEFISCYDNLMKVLYYLGLLSQPAFDTFDELYELYNKQYISTPELGKKLWLEHYDKLHQPYTVLKNRCWRLLDELDNIYMKINKHNPPNWIK